MNDKTEKAYKKMKVLRTDLVELYITANTLLSVISFNSSPFYLKPHVLS